MRKLKDCPEDCKNNKTDKKKCKECKSELIKKKKIYHKIIKKYNKKLKKDIKEFRPYDWGFIASTIIDMLKYMYEYYDNGYNVYQVDESRLEIVKSLGEVLNLFNEADKVNDGVNFKDIATKEGVTLEQYLNEGFNREAFVNDYTVKWEQFDEYYKKAFTKIGEDIQMWWD